MFVVYLIQHSETKDLYVGVTNNLTRRLKQHNQGNNVSTYRKSGVWILVYAEAYRSRKDAMLREAKLKQRGSAKQKLYTRIKNSLIEIKN